LPELLGAQLVSRLADENDAWNSSVVAKSAFTSPTSSGYDLPLAILSQIPRP
jgi:hypothetical protein